MLILDPLLEAAQENQSRHPLVEIKSLPALADIPFDGQHLTEVSENEQSPNAITHSSGRVCLVYAYGFYTDVQNFYDLKYVYTDVDRTVFTFKNFRQPSGQVLVDASLCELANGNIGIIMLIDDGFYYQLQYKIITVTGEPVSPSGMYGTTIATYLKTTYWINSPFVIRLQDGTFLMVYAHSTGSTYKIMKRTCPANFTEWSAIELECEMAGLASSKRRDFPSLIQIDTGDIFLWFDYLESVSGTAELINCYYSISTNNGSTWGAAVPGTNYLDYSAVARHPIAAQKMADQLYLIFTEQRSALHMSENSEFYCGEPLMYGADVFNMHFNPVSRYLYVLWGNNFYGTKNISCVTEIDVDAWTIYRCWDCSTFPGFNPAYCAEHVFYFWQGARHFVPVGVGGQTGGQGYGHLSILNADTEVGTITTYRFGDWPDYDLHQNVNWEVESGTIGNLVRCAIDFGRSRLYLVFTGGNGVNMLRVGYIDLNAPPDSEKNYTFHLILSTTTLGDVHDWFGDFLLIPELGEEGYFVVSCYNSGSWGVYSEKTQVYDIAEVAITNEWKYPDPATFPHHGLYAFQYYNWKLYCLFTYYGTPPQEELRGLCVIDLLTDDIQYYRPTWDIPLPANNYHFVDLCITDDGKILITGCYGVTMFDPLTSQWTLWNNASLPGMTSDGNDYYTHAITYDPATGLIFAGYSEPYGTSELIAFSRYGMLKRAYYSIGTYSSGWTFAEADPLVLGFIDYDLVVALHPVDKSIYAFWTNKRVTELSIKWDKEGSDWDLSPYLVKDVPIVAKESINGDPSSLTFAVKDGHLFDPFNTHTLLSMYLKKGRKITLRFGEKVSGTDYWQAQGTFYVTATKVEHKRGQYPVMNVTTQDRRVFWRDNQIIATDYFDNPPEEIIKSVLVAYTDMLNPGDFNLPVFDGNINIRNQWVDTILDEIIKQVAERFSYFLRMDVNGKLSARKIADDNEVDHTYSNLTKIINFSPDDSYSDFINQIVVAGEEEDYIDVLYAEERVGELHGTCGWYGFNKDFYIWYSQDKSRRCRNPRMNVLESALSGLIGSLGTSQGITENLIIPGPEDPDYEKYCIIEVDATDLTLVFVPLCLLYIAWQFTPDEVITYYGEGFTVRWGTYVGAIIAWQILDILGSMGNFQYEIFANPVGKVRRSVQGTADDLDLQAQLGYVISKKFDDPLCYSPEQCVTVATQELLIAKLQRQRATFEKMADLRDETGDTIQFLHPQTLETLTFFITELTRTMKLGKDGYFIDVIEGWKLERTI